MKPTTLKRSARLLLSAAGTAARSLCTRGAQLCCSGQRAKCSCA